MSALFAQLARFGVVGLAGFVVDVGLFNLLRATVLDPAEVHGGPVIAKVISTSVAILVNWLGNRHWTFRSHRRAEVVREGIEFVLVSLGGMVITLGCLWVSHYALGFTSLLADNISGNVIGLALGTAFRFAFYRQWVFHPRRGGTNGAGDLESGAPEGAVVPAGLTPLHRVQAVSTVDDRALGND